MPPGPLYAKAVRDQHGSFIFRFKDTAVELLRASLIGCEWGAAQRDDARQVAEECSFAMNTFSR